MHAPRTWALLAAVLCTGGGGALVPFDRTPAMAPIAATDGAFGCVYHYAESTSRTAGTAPGRPTGQDGGVGGGQLAAVDALLATLARNCTPAVDLGSVMAGGGTQYQVCFGPGQAVQQVSDGGTFHLGSADGGAQVDREGVYVQYSQGQGCTALARSARVYLACGDVAAVVRASEPSTCVYSLMVTHPTLCAAPDGLLPRLKGVMGVGGLSATGGGRDSPATMGVTASILSQLPDHVASWVTEYTDAAGAVAAAGAGGGADVMGMGGRSIGVDDRHRRSVTWTGLRDADVAGGKDSMGAPIHQTTAAWALDVMSRPMAPPSAASAPWQPGVLVSCTAYSTDDLRRSGGTIGSAAASATGGGAHGAAGGHLVDEGLPACDDVRAQGNVFQSGTWLIVVRNMTGGRVEGEGAEEGEVQVLAAAARTANRNALPMAVMDGQQLRMAWEGSSGGNVPDEVVRAMKESGVTPIAAAMVMAHDPPCQPRDAQSQGRMWTAQPWAPDVMTLTIQVSDQPHA